MAVETPQHKALLAEIQLAAQKLAAQEATVKKTRTHLQQLMVKAKTDRISSYRIAEAVNLSQPRVMQIIKEVAKAAAEQEKDE